MRITATKTQRYAQDAPHKPQVFLMVGHTYSVPEDLSLPMATRILELEGAKKSEPEMETPEDELEEPEFGDIESEMETPEDGLEEKETPEPEVVETKVKSSKASNRKSRRG